MTTMPRYARATLPEVPYHIIHRGNNRQAIFFCDNDYLYFLDTLRSTKEKYECKLYAYVLMTNHVHLLVEPLVAEHLAKFMKQIAQKYAQYVNYFYKRTGTLWEGRFKSSPVSMDNYLLACCRYIELNPVRAGLVKSLEDYRWSSYSGKVGMKRENLLDLDIWYESLGDSDEERQQSYKKWISESIPDYEWGLIRESINRGGVFGNNRFKEQIEEAIGRKIILRGKGRPRKE